MLFNAFARDSFWIEFYQTEIGAVYVSLTHSNNRMWSGMVVGRMEIFRASHQRNAEYMLFENAQRLKYDEQNNQNSLMHFRFLAKHFKSATPSFGSNKFRISKWNKMCRHPSTWWSYFSNKVEVEIERFWTTARHWVPMYHYFAAKRSAVFPSLAGGSHFSSEFWPTIYAAIKFSQTSYIQPPRAHALVASWIIWIKLWLICGPIYLVHRSFRRWRLCSSHRPTKFWRRYELFFSR